MEASIAIYYNTVATGPRAGVAAVRSPQNSSQYREIALERKLLSKTVEVSGGSMVCKVLESVLLGFAGRRPIG